jgi:branched-chain amino acid aminotransferase
MPGRVQTLGNISKTWTFFEDAWHEGNVPIMGPRTHGAWLGSSVFDGARAFEGVMPDLDLHCARVNASAAAMLLKAVVPTDRWVALATEGVGYFEKNAELYIRPMYWADSGMAGGVRFDPETTRWCLTIYEAPMPAPTGVSVTLSPYRRPTPECAPTLAKAGCLYPNNSRALIEAFGRGYDNCLLRDLNGNIAELANANVFMAKDETVYTPVPNGTFLDGITRRRVIGLLRNAGVAVIETTLDYAAFQTADEIFSSGNYTKVAPVNRIEEKQLPLGPMYRLARKLYWSFAHGCTSACEGL